MTDASSSGAPPSEGLQQVGRYQIHYMLGRGGMGSVYLSRMIGEGGFERWVAIKRLHEHLTDNPEVTRMFLDEARTSARLHHPNLVQVTDFGTEGGVPFLAMEYVNGENLSAVLRRCAKRGEPLARELAARIVAWVCDGLHHAHEAQTSAGEDLGLVHRDVSPQNILLSYDGQVQVTDFGIAKAADHYTQTRTGQLKGKTAYMAPEQVMSRPVDRRTDIFALGIVLFEATLGRRLFKADNEFESLQRITAGRVPHPTQVEPDYPLELEAITLRALSTNPDERYQSARDMQRDLERFLASSGKPVSSVDLAELMEHLFADRIEARRERLRSSAPAFEADRVLAVPEFTPISRSLPVLSSQSTPPTRSADPPARGDGKNPWKLIAALSLATLALAVVVGGGLLAWLLSSERDQATPPEPVPQAETVVQAAAPVPGPVPIPTPPEVDGGEAEADAVVHDADVDTGPAKVASVQTGPGRKQRPHVKAPTKVEPEPAGPPGTISIMASPWCDVFLGGQRLGRTPIIRRQLPAGRHTLKLLPQGQAPGVSRAVTVRSGQETPVNINLNQ